MLLCQAPNAATSSSSPANPATDLLHYFQKITETPDPCLEHQSHLQTLVWLTTADKPQAWLHDRQQLLSRTTKPLLLGGELNIKHFISQESVLEGCGQPQHCPVQDPSDQPCSEENRA